MRMPNGVLASVAGTMGAVWLLTGATAIAQEGQARAPAGKETLDRTFGVRSGGNDEAAEVQKRVDASRSSVSSLIASQEAELASLEDQLARVQGVGRSVTPLMLLMIDGIETFVALDVPFLIEERTERMVELRKLMTRADVTNAEKYRQIMEAYQIENEYGRTIESYRGAVELGDRETTVDFLRFGRISLVYQSLDQADSGVWNQETRSWDRLDSSYRSAIRQGLRIARKQAAPDLIRLPLPVATQAGGAS